MIDIENLVKKIGDKLILRNVSLTIDDGETVAILGPNGAGKSTLLKILSTLIKPTSGQVMIDGKLLSKNVNQIRMQLGYLPHDSLLYEHFSPLENLMFYGKLYRVEHPETRARTLTAKVGLSYFLNEPVKGFSRGMVQRIAIARAIVHDPVLLLLDEPHTGLDQKAIAILNDVIVENKQRNATTLMVTHDFKQAAEICDRAIVIKNGKIVDDFTISRHEESELMARYHQIIGGEE